VPPNLLNFKRIRAPQLLPIPWDNGFDPPWVIGDDNMQKGILRRLFVAVGILVVSSALAVAQAPAAGNGEGSGRGPKRGGFHGRDCDRDDFRWARNLNLTDAQKSQLRSDCQTSQQQLQALRNDTSLSRDQRRAKEREIRKAEHQQVIALLTDDQKSRLKDERREHKGGRGARGRHQQPSPAV
jgi:periplasmic protein CpxP/Spy